MDTLGPRYEKTRLQFFVQIEKKTLAKNVGTCRALATKRFMGWSLTSMSESMSLGLFDIHELKYIMS